MTARRAVPLQYAVLVLLAAVVNVVAVVQGRVLPADFFLFPPYSDRVFPVLLASAVVVVVHALRRPSWARIGTAALALATTPLACYAPPPEAFWSGTRHFLRARRPELDAFVADIRAYGRIHQMTDGLRHSTSLNDQGIEYDPSAPGVDTTLDALPAGVMSAVVPVEQVLARDGIDRRRYEEFRRRLTRLGLIELDVRPGYVAFLRDGFLDNLEGYLYLPPGGALPEIGSDLFLCRLVALEPMGDGWYWFATT